MKIAILITLDYATPRPEDTQFIWSEIHDKMLSAGFDFSGRLFSIDVPEPDEAYDLARSTLESFELHRSFEDRCLHKHLKEFCGFPIEKSVNLLLPDSENIEVVELDSKESRMLLC